MIQNLKIYTMLNTSGTHSLMIKMWTRSGTYKAQVPIGSATARDIGKLRSLFSSIRSNFIGLNEEDWVTFDSLVKQLNTNDTIGKPLSLALSIACGRAATNNELWKLKARHHSVNPSI